VIADQSGGNLTLGISTGERIVLKQTQVVALRESAVSLMPEVWSNPSSHRNCAICSVTSKARMPSRQSHEDTAMPFAVEQT